MKMMRDLSEEEVVAVANKCTHLGDSLDIFEFADELFKAAQVIHNTEGYPQPCNLIAPL